MCSLFLEALLERCLENQHRIFFFSMVSEGAICGRCGPSFIMLYREIANEFEIEN
jgi:hypothetical protein